MLRKLFHPLYLMIGKPLVKHEVIISLKAPLPEGVPIIFAANHTCVHDAPIILTSIRKHAYVMADDAPRYKLAGFQLFLNGVIWVKRDNKESGIRAKTEAVRQLSKKRNILILPEGTWNTSDNLLMLPFHKGVIDIAKESNAIIVPVVLDYCDKTCRVVIDEPFMVNTDAASVDLTARLRDMMATIKWELIEGHIAKRSEVSKAGYDERIRCLHSELAEVAVYDCERETAAILKLYDTVDEVFAHLDTIEVKKENAFLLKPR